MITSYIIIQQMGNQDEILCMELHVVMPIPTSIENLLTGAHFPAKLTYNEQSPHMSYFMEFITVSEIIRDQNVVL